MTSNEQSEEPGYAAFISYAREDEAFAKRLETEIEAHQRPGNASAVRVFRDRSDFTGSAYESALEGHLRNSATLIVVCSPDARKSTFVGDEIKRFASLHGADRIFPILVSGLADNEAEDKRAFPPALLEVMQGRGMPLGAEYRGLDLHRERVSAGRFEGEWYKLLGNIYGVTPAEIRDEDAQRQVRIQRRRVLASGAVALLLLAALGGALSLWQRARVAERQAVANEQEARHQKDEALKLKERAEKAERLASEMSEKAQTELGLQVKAAADPAAARPTPGAAGLPARVYFHIRDERQRSIAEDFKSKLEQQGLGLVVPGIERLDVGPTRTSELRFFREVDRAEADRIGQALRDEGVSDVTVKKIPGYEESTMIRPRHFELWLKGDIAEAP